MNDMEYAETLAEMLRSLDDSTLQKQLTFSRKRLTKERSK